MSAHKSPEQVRSQLSHPIVDGDGHWLEYAPVFSEKMRKAAGDKAADGFLAALRSTTDALKLTPAERSRRRVAQPNFWNRQAENTLDRATAMMPKMLYERLDGLGDRMTPAAIIPMHHPEEAIAELEFVTKQLGSKVGMFGSGMPRRIEAA